MASAGTKSESSYDIEIPEEFMEDDVDFGASKEEDTGDPAQADPTGDETPEGDPGQLLSDKDLSDLGITRDSPAHKALEAKFFPKWQEKLRRAGLTASEVRERERERAELGARVDKLEAGGGKESNAQDEPVEEPWVDWNGFKPSVDVTDIYGSEDDARKIETVRREELEFTVRAVVGKLNLQAEQQQANVRETEIAKTFTDWAESIKDHPDFTEAKGKDIIEIAKRPSSKQLLLEDPQGFMEFLESKTGLRAQVKVAPVSAVPAKRTGNGNTPVTRSRPMSSAASAQPSSVDQSYEDIVASAMREVLG